MHSEERNSTVIMCIQQKLKNGPICTQSKSQEFSLPQAIKTVFFYIPQTILIPFNSNLPGEKSKGKGRLLAEQ